MKRIGGTNRTAVRVSCWSTAILAQQDLVNHHRHWRVLNYRRCFQSIANPFRTAPVSALHSEKEFSLSLFFFYIASCMIANTLRIFGMLLDGSALSLFTEKKMRVPIRARTRFESEEWSRKWSIVLLIVEILCRSPRIFICRAIASGKISASNRTLQSEFDRNASVLIN